MKPLIKSIIDIFVKTKNLPPRHKDTKLNTTKIKEFSFVSLLRSTYFWRLEAPTFGVSYWQKKTFYESINN